MKNGGNKMINGLFEAKLTEKQRKAARPDNHTDLDERSSFIYDKYQHRKWYSEEEYNRRKVREKADAALAKKQTANKTAMEDDFFAARTAKNANAGGERFATKTKVVNEEEWWKGDNERGEKVVKSKDAPKTKSSSPGKTFDFLGDRRQLLSSLQVESKSRLMSDLSGLGIDGDKGATPSQLKKSSRSKQRKTGLSPAPQETKPKSSRKPPGRSKSAMSTSSGDSDSLKPSSSRLIRKAAPPRSASGPMVNTGHLGESFHSNSTPISRKTKTVNPRLGRVKSFDENGEKRSRSSSAKKSRGAARKNKALVASLYDGTLMDSIATGLASVDTTTTDDASTKRSFRRRRDDDESQVSSRRQSSRSGSRDDRSQASSRRHRSSSRKKRDPRKKRDGTSSVSRTPSPDLTQDSRRRVLSSNVPPRSPRMAPIKIKRVPREKAKMSQSPVRTLS